MKKAFPIIVICVLAGLSTMLVLDYFYPDGVSKFFGLRVTESQTKKEIQTASTEQVAALSKQVDDLRQQVVSLSKLVKEIPVAPDISDLATASSVESLKDVLVQKISKAVWQQIVSGVSVSGEEGGSHTLALVDSGEGYLQIADVTDAPVSSSENCRTKTDSDIPIATRVMGKPGFVLSPFTDARQVVDVTGLESNTTVRCPYTGRLFRVP